MSVWTQDSQRKRQRSRRAPTTDRPERWQRRVAPCSRRCHRAQSYDTRAKARIDADLTRKGDATRSLGRSTVTFGTQIRTALTRRPEGASQPTHGLGAGHASAAHDNGFAATGRPCRSPASLTRERQQRAHLPERPRDAGDRAATRRQKDLIASSTSSYSRASCTAASRTAQPRAHDPR